MNQAVFWVMPSARPSSWLLMPFFALTSIQMATIHLSRRMREDSSTVPVRRLNCGAAWSPRQRHRRYASM